MSGEAEDLLDQCLEALRRGGTVEECLGRYPEHAKELEPLLLIAQAVIRSPLADPNPELKSETRRSLPLPSRAPYVESQLEDVLSHCIDLVIDGYSVEKCLELYPRHANAIAPLLQIAAGLRQAFALEPSSDFKRGAFRRIVASAGQRRPHRWLPWVSWPKWGYRGAVAVAVFLVIFLIGAGTFKASSDSMPDDLLYPVKEFSEKVQLTLATSKDAEAKLHVKLANRRAEEMAEMAREGDYKTFKTLMGDLEEHLAMVPILVQEKQLDQAIKVVFQEKGSGEIEFDSVRGLLQILGRDIKMNSARFKNVLQGAPLEMKSEMKSALYEVKEFYDRTIQALEYKYSTDGLDSLNGMRLVLAR
ncbi:MAG: DUF5667 domain-containing protein [Dehalococcoidia bacterium]